MLQRSKLILDIVDLKADDMAQEEPQAIKDAKLAVELAEKGKLPKALQAEANYRAGRAYYAKGSAESALKYFKKAIQNAISPEAATYQLYAGEICLSLRNESDRATDAWKTYDQLAKEYFTAARADRKAIPEIRKLADDYIRKQWPD